jgi:YggT family protein
MMMRTMVRDVRGRARGTMDALRASAAVGASAAVERVRGAVREVAVVGRGEKTRVTIRGRRRRGDGSDGGAFRCDPRLRGKFLAAMIPGDSVVESVITSGLYSTLNIYNTLLIGRLILTWFPNPPRQIMYPLATICDPYLGLFRGIIPPLGGIDLSPILAFTVLNVFQGTAAALPCEYDEKTGEVRVPKKR